LERLSNSDYGNATVEACHPEERWFELELHGIKSQKTSIIDIAVRAFRKTVFFDRNTRFEVFTAVTMKNGVFWNITPCGSFKNRRFGGT
jgi:hypothetical protein